MQRNAPQRSGVNSPRLFNVFDYSGARVRHRSNQTRPTRIHTYCLCSLTVFMSLLTPVFMARVGYPSSASRILMRALKRKPLFKGFVQIY